MQTRWLTLVLALVLLQPLPLPVRAQGTDLIQIHEEQQGYSGRLQEIRAEEQATLAELFGLNRTLEEIRTDLVRLGTEIGAVQAELEELAAEEGRLRERYQSALQLFGRRARFMFEQGPSAYLNVLMGATSLADFLQRMEFVELAIRQDARLLSIVRDLRRQVAVQHERLQAERTRLVGLRDRQEAKKRDLEVAIAAREDKLATLKERRGAVEIALGSLESLWEDRAKPILASFGKAFHAAALNVQDLSPDAVQFHTFPPGATVVVSTAGINRFLTKFEPIKDLQFRLAPGQANLVGDFSGVALEIEGNFSIASDSVLRYAPQHIRFYGVAISAPATAELVQSGTLDIDLGSIIAPGKLVDVQVEEGRILVKAGLK